MSHLPSSWAVAPLGDLLTDVLGGGTPDKSKADNFRGDIPFMTVKDMHSRFIDDTQDHISQEALESSASRIIPADTLVIASRMSLGKIARPTRAVAINQDLKALFLSDGVSKAYIEYAWRANADQIQAMGTGTTVKGIRLEDIRGLEVPVAPTAEQTRIADQLDTLLARIQACQDRLDAIPALLKQFRQAVWDAAAGGTLTEDWRAEKGAGKGWTSCTLADAIEEMRNGLSAEPTEHPPGKRILRIGAVRPGILDRTDFRFLDLTSREAASYALHEGDLLFTRYNGTLEFVGACAVVTSDLNEYVYPDKLIRVRVKRGVVMPEFLAVVAAARSAREQIEKFVKSSAGQKGISGRDLKSVRVSLPGMDEQVEIVRRVKSLLHFFARVEAQHAKASAWVRRLAPITLAKAFRGELIPQDPNDEPASALLARIAAERSAPAALALRRSPRAGRPPRAPKETAAMTKSRQDHDVMGQPYLAGHLRRLTTPATAEALFKVAELPVADFYKQLAWEVAQGHVKDKQTTLEPGHAAG